MLARVWAVLVVVALAGCGRLGFAGDAGAADDADFPAEATDGPGSDTVVFLAFEDDPSDGILSDTSGHGIDAQCIAGLTCPTPVTGKHGMGVQFNGSTQYALITHRAAFDTPNAFTIAVWAYLDDASVDQVVIGKPDRAGSNNSWGLVSWTGSRTCLETTIAGDVKQDVCAPAVLGQATWYHLAATYDGAMKTLYINGAKAASIPGSPIELDSHDVIFGADQNAGAGAYWWHGRIDELRYYDRALTPAQILVIAAP